MVLIDLVQTLMDSFKHSSVLLSHNHRDFGIVGAKSMDLVLCMLSENVLSSVRVYLTLWKKRKVKIGVRGKEYICMNMYVYVNVCACVKERKA